MSDGPKKRGDDSEVIATSDALLDVLSNSITTHQSAEIAILHLMNEYSFSPSTLQQVLLGVFQLVFSKEV